MAFDAFISYSAKDPSAANEVRAALEATGLRCWIAPRDILAGESWPAAIIRGIDASVVLVLIFSSNANLSEQVQREVSRAISREVPVIPFRVENVTPTDAMEYFLGPVHWLDAYTPPLSQHFERLITTIRALIRAREDPKKAIAKEWKNIVAEFEYAQEHFSEFPDEYISRIYQSLEGAAYLKLRTLKRDTGRSNLFSAVETLSRLGIDVRSKTWGHLVALKNSRLHNPERLSTADIAQLIDSLPELRTILDKLSPQAPESK